VVLKCTRTVRCRKKDRENFINSDLTLLLPATRAELLLAGDFSCILNTIYRTGNAPRSKCLERIFKELELRHVWDVSKALHGFTHYVPLSATRLNRIYVTGNLVYIRKRGVETVATAFNLLLISVWQQMCLSWSGDEATGK
jgi:hypothetical protein